jgi:hypothetical protein
MNTTGQLAPAVIGQKIHKTFHRDTGEATRALDNGAAPLLRWSDQMARGRLPSSVWPLD